MSNLELFKNYIKLSYKPGLRDNILVDKKLGNLVLLRKTYLGNTIYYLTDGSRLFIPWEWFDVFSGLYMNSGDQILYKKPETDDYFEQFIYLGTKLQIYLLGYSKIDGSGFLNTLGDICNLRTEKFINLVEDYIKLTPFEYNSIKHNFNI